MQTFEIFKIKSRFAEEGATTKNSYFTKLQMKNINRVGPTLELSGNSVSVNVIVTKRGRARKQIISAKS